MQRDPRGPQIGHAPMLALLRLASGSGLFIGLFMFGFPTGDSHPLAKESLAKHAVGAKFPSMPTVKAQRPSVKTQAIRLIRDLPASSSWDDLMYRIYVRQKIEAGLVDIQTGRVHSHAAIRKEFAQP